MVEVPLDIEKEYTVAEIERSNVVILIDEQGNVKEDLKVPEKIVFKIQ